MKKDYVWYKQPGWWMIIMILLVLLGAAALAPTPGGHKQDFDTRLIAYPRVTCYIAPPTEPMTVCQNPAYIRRATLHGGASASARR